MRIMSDPLIRYHLLKFCMNTTQTLLKTVSAPPGEREREREREREKERDFTRKECP